MKLKWHMFAGGTSAARGKHGYSTSRYDFGYYDITPIANRYGRHLGYRLHFINNMGKLAGGLWQQLGILFASPNEAKGAARRHYEKHFKK